MITNERQHRITTAEIKRFEDAIQHALQEGPASDVHPRLHEAMIDGLRSQHDELRAEATAYEALRDGKITRRVFTSLRDLPSALIEGRIVRRLTQRELGRKLGIPEQEVQRYEQTRYAGANLERLQTVADVVGIKLTKTVEYEVARPSKAAAEKTRPTQQTGRPRRARAASGSSSGRSHSPNRKSLSTARKGGETIPSRKTGKAAASAAGRTLASASTSKTAKKAAASDLSQVGNRKVTGKKAASAAGKTLASKSTPKTAKKAAASDLSQRARKKR